MADVIIRLAGLSEIRREGTGQGCNSGVIWVGPAEHESAVKVAVRSDPRLKMAFGEGAEIWSRPVAGLARAELRRHRDIVRCRLTGIKPFSDIRERFPYLDDQLQWAAETAEDVWSLVENERVAATTVKQASPPPAASASGTAETRVAEYIKQQIGTGKPLISLTRDGIAHALGLSGGAVSNTRAWIMLRDSKRRETAAANIDEEIRRAKATGDWDRVRQLIDRQERQAARQPPEDESE